MKQKMVLASTGIAQCFEISYFNIKFMAKANEKYVFYSNELTKVLGRNPLQHPLTLTDLSKTSLCVASLLETYMQCSEPC